MAQGGKSLNDRKLAASVRTLGLRELERILQLEDCEYKREIMKKLAPTLLPRLNEHTGEDGDEIKVKTVQIVSYANTNPAQLHPSSISTSGSSGDGQGEKEGGNSVAQAIR